MNILIVGDVFGSVGRLMLKEYLPSLQEDYKIDFTIVNGENITHGKSMNVKSYNFLKSLNVDVITGGNHSFDNYEFLQLVENHDVLRPLNVSPYAPGKGTMIYKAINNKTIRVSNLLGCTYMMGTNHYFAAFDKILQLEKPAIHIVDFHAETTSEKILFGTYYDGAVTAVFGTHTHVMTADNRILPSKTAFLTDVGMTGPYYSIIGLNPDPMIERFNTGIPQKFGPADGPGQLCAWFLKIDDQTDWVIDQKRIYITPDQPYQVN